MIAVKKILGIGLISVTALSLSGCGLIPLPDEERYFKVNAVKSQLDFESAGKVISEEYSGDGVWSGSTYTAEIEGESSFESLKEQLIEIVEPPQSCTVTEILFDCVARGENPKLLLVNDGIKTTLTITDHLGGHNEN